MKKITKFNDIDENNVIVISNLQNVPEDHIFIYSIVYLVIENKKFLFEVEKLVLTGDSYITLKHLLLDIKFTFYEHELEEWLEMFEDNKSNYPQYLI
jgi:hypothetical protein